MVLERLAREPDFPGAIIEQDEIVARAVHLCEFEEHERKV